MKAKDREITGQEIAKWAQWLKDRGASAGAVSELAQTLSGKTAGAISNIISDWVNQQKA